MASYLCVKMSGSVTKRYNIKSSANKPYLRVGTGFIPLTTATATGPKLMVRADGTNYRLADFITTTTAITTGTSYLTSQKTTGTSYETASRASTSSTGYESRVSTSATTYYTRKSTSATTYYTRVSTSATATKTRSSTSKTGYIYTTESYTGRGSSRAWPTGNVTQAMGVQINFATFEMTRNGSMEIHIPNPDLNCGVIYTLTNGNTGSVTIPHNIYYSNASISANYYNNNKFEVDNPYLPELYEVTTANNRNTQAFGFSADIKDTYVDGAITRSWVTNGTSITSTSGKRSYYENFNLVFTANYSSNKFNGSGYSPQNKIGYTTYTVCSHSLSYATATTYATRASTSSTIYYTRASTSTTSYLTRQSTSTTSYLTRSSTSNTTYATRSSQYTSNTVYLTQSETYQTSYLTTSAETTMEG